MTPSLTEIFFSYAWGDEQETGQSREKIVNELFESLKADDYNVVRDKNDLGYRGYISDFMQRIGEGQNIVVAISEKYVRSPYCMFELYEIARNCRGNKEEFSRRVLPIVVERIDFDDIDILEQHLSYWEEKYNKYEAIAQKRARQLSIDWQKEFDRIKTINQDFSKLIVWIKDMNTSTPDLLSADNFAAVKKTIQETVILVKKDPSVAAERKTSTVLVQFHETTIGYGKKDIKKILSAPFIPETFLGREAELENIYQRLFTQENLLLLVNGEGGMGKTSLAAKYFFDYQYYYRHLAWVFAETGIDDALLTLAMPLQINFPETSTTEQRLQLLLDEMRNLNEPCLLVIDNANDSRDLEIHYPLLRSCPNFHLLLTSRLTKFQQAKTYKIEGLPEGKALELFRTHYPKHQPAEDEIFKQIRTAVGGNTLVLEILAKNLYQLNQLKNNYSLADLLADLQKNGLLALQKTKAVEVWYHAKNALRTETPEAIIGTMYHVGELTEPEKQLLSVFAVLPAENIAYTVLEKLFQGMEGLEDNLPLLAKKGWLDFNEKDNTFKISPVVQEITRRKNLQLFEGCRKLIKNLTNLLEYQTGSGHFNNVDYEEAAIYARYAETVAKNFNIPEHNFGVLLERLGSYHSTTGNPQKALEYFELYEKLSALRCASYPENIDFKNSLAIAHSKLGETQASLGNLTKALEYFEIYSKLRASLHADYPQNAGFKNGLAITYSKLGDTHTSLGHLQIAREYYEKRLVLGEELYTDYPQNVSFKNGLAIAYERLGVIQTSLGNFQKALEYFENENKLFKQLYTDYPQNVSIKKGLAIAYLKLGETQASLGNDQKALEYYEDEIKLFEQLYADYPQNVSFKNGLAVSYSNLGATHYSLGNRQKALDYYELDATLMEALYSDYPLNVSFKNGLAIAYIKLGVANEDKPDKLISKGFYEAAKKLLVVLVRDFPDYVEFKENLDLVNNKLLEF